MEFDKEGEASKDDQKDEEIFSMPQTKEIEESEKEPETPLVSLKILFLLIISIAAFDFFLYQSSGGIGYACLFLIMAGFISIAGFFPYKTKSFFTSILLLAIVARSMWQSDGFTLWVGFFVLFIFSSSIFERSLYIPDLIKSLWLSIWRTPQSLIDAGRLIFCFQKLSSSRRSYLPIIVPGIVMLAFLCIFGLANTVISSWLTIIGNWVESGLEELYQMLFSPQRFFFWLFSGLIVAVLLFPCEAIAFKKWSKTKDNLREEPPGNSNDLHFLIARNTLIGVNFLFLVYNIVDIKYLWIKQGLPTGIVYSDYARSGVFWLTVALALTSLVLGIVFSGSLNFHKRFSLLKKITLFWTWQNLFLAFSAYQRLYIYFGFNGLTRMRIVGTFGITLVVIGLVIVLKKVLQGKSFSWMVRCQLMFFALTIFVLLLFPSDYLVTHVNVNRILSAKNLDEIAPAVILSHHPISPEGLPGLIPLLYINNSNLSEKANKRIREGIAGILLREREKLFAKKDNKRWTDKEFATNRAQIALIREEKKIRELIPNGQYQIKIRQFIHYTKIWW